MGSRYVNGVDVLAPALVEEISRAVGGRAVVLYIPAARLMKREKRDEYIVGLHREGYTPAEIGERVFLSERTIKRVLKRGKERAVGQPSRGDGARG